MGGYAILIDLPSPVQPTELQSEGQGTAHCAVHAVTPLSIAYIVCKTCEYYQ
jgi:hypothetical protein